jgi:bacillolysin
MAELQRFHFHAGDTPVEDAGRAALRGVRGAREAAGAPAGFHSDEAAARYHLSHLLAGDDRPGLRSITSPERAERVPDLRLQSTQDLPQTNTRLVTFTQTKDNIPIFASKAVCEIDEQRALVSASGRVGRVKDVSPFPSVSQEEALRAIADFAGSDPGEIAPGVLNFYEDEETGWHLVFVFDRVPVAPKEMREHAKGHGLGSSPRSRNPLVTYLVDAHSGKVVFHFSDSPLLAAPLPVPTTVTGIGEDGGAVEIWGELVEDRFRLSDPLRDIKTYDLAFGDIDGAVLTDPYASDDAQLGDDCRGLTSAHANATKVFDFINGVLLRDGIDGLGMELINVVNVTSAADEAPPAWHNAVWWDDRMWYGQAPGADGKLVSFARHLDVIAHELTHGVTQYTADLVYKNQSGALNESFSDIFGIIIKNWTPPDGGDVGTWDWQLGRGLGPGGGPLRDLSDPASTGDPAHMDDYVVTYLDEGGVHINSNIHNKAAHNVLTATDASGGYVFTPREVSYLYYLALTRLGRLDGFDDALEALVTVAMTYYAGDPAKRDARVAALRNAYGMVGIS